MELKEIALDQIDHPQVEHRSTVDQEYLESLAQSIKEIGLQNPIRVKEDNGRYVIISGNCRYIAHKMLGIETIPCIVGAVQVSLIPAMTLHENLIREDVSHMDTALYLAWYRDEKKLSVESLAKTFRHSSTWIYQHLKLLECPEDFRNAIDAGMLNYQSALELMKLPDEVRRRSLFDAATRSGATFNVVKGWVLSELAALGLRPAALPVSMGNAMNIPPELTFICACCTNIQTTEKMIMIRVCPECYSIVMQAIKIMRDQIPLTVNRKETENAGAA